MTLWTHVSFLRLSRYSNTEDAFKSLVLITLNHTQDTHSIKEKQNNGIPPPGSMRPGSGQCLSGRWRVRFGIQAGEHREDEVPERGVLSDEEAGGVSVCVLQGRLLLGGDVLLLGAVPRVLQARSGRQRDVGSGAVHGPALQQPPLLLVQLRQDGDAGLVRKAWPRRVGRHARSSAAGRVSGGSGPWRRLVAVPCLRDELIKLTEANVANRPGALRTRGMLHAYRC